MEYSYASSLERQRTVADDGESRQETLVASPGTEGIVVAQGRDEEEDACFVHSLN